MSLWQKESMSERAKGVNCRSRPHTLTPPLEDVLNLHTTAATVTTLLNLLPPISCRASPIGIGHGGLPSEPAKAHTKL